MSIEKIEGSREPLGSFENPYSVPTGSYCVVRGRRDNFLVHADRRGGLLVYGTVANTWRQLWAYYPGEKSSTGATSVPEIPDTRPADSQKGKGE